MTLDADMLVDRRRMRRKVTFWRVVAVVLVLGLIGLAASYFSDEAGFGRGPHVARVAINGFIDDDRKQQDMLRKIAKDGQVKALILAINSPGGTTTGAEALYEAIREVADEKPVVATLGTVAASGGYIAAIAADHIVARGNSITGSIGVIFQWAKARDLLDKVGVQFEEVKSSPLKAEPDPFTDTPAEARAVMEAMIKDSYDWFVGLVGERRKLPDYEARRLGDGRVYTGRQALEARLVDAIGGEETARDWLEREHDISRDLKVQDWQPAQELSALSLVKSAARISGLGGLLNRLVAFAPRGSADGLLSVWHAGDLQAE